MEEAKEIKEYPKGFLLLHNVGKNKNMGTLIRYPKFKFVGFLFY